MNRAKWQPVARIDEVQEGAMKRVEVAGKRVLIAHTGGRFYAVEDNCSHEDFSLSYGCLEGDMVKCSLHGSHFSLITGEPQEDPATDPIDTYPVNVIENTILVKLP